MSQDKVRERWGEKFNVVEEGLDENQVVNFVDELIQQRDTLEEQRNSLLTYIRLSRSLVAKKEESTEISNRQADNVMTDGVNRLDQGFQAVIENKEPNQVTPLLSPEATEAETDREKPVLYHSEVELAILPPVDVLALLQFERGLKNAFELKIVSMDGSPSKGSLITVLLGRPQSLLQGLKQMPEVEEAVDEMDTPSNVTTILPWRFISKQGARIWVTLRQGVNS